MLYPFFRWYNSGVGVVPERRKMSEDMSVFKSYLRRLLQDLKDLKEVLKSKDYEKAEKMVDQLIDDTQKGIEDN